MAEIEIKLPKMGESVTEATITNWLKEVGDTIEMDEPLVEVATDKVDNELPSEAEGTLIKILFDKDDVAQVGDVIAIISTDGGSASPEPVKEVQAENKTAEIATTAPAVSNGESVSKTIELNGIELIVSLVFFALSYVITPPTPIFKPKSINSWAWCKLPVNA